MILLENDRLAFRFPDVHADAECRIQFQRTLRLPDDDRDYPLPPGLGAFPLRHLDDHAGRLPPDWRRRGGVLLPMYQAEAMWLHFSTGYPCAVKVGTGKINAVTGEAWSNGLNRDPQDYLAIPRQPWLDGYCVAKGVIRQFVAMPLGEGWSAEEQLTGKAEWGGLQIAVYPMKAERYEALRQRRRAAEVKFSRMAAPSPACAMGLAPGGRMKQEIYDDPHDLADYDQRRAGRCFVTILNSVAWQSITGERPPMQPPTARDYAKAGLPWFDWYDAEATAVAGSTILDRLKSLAQFGKAKTGVPADVADSVTPGPVVGLGPQRQAPVREADS